MPYFSVVIPTYNRSGFIVNCLLSVLKQSFTDFEIIVIDDGSTDNTKELIEKLTEKEQRIRYFFISNSERGLARNFGWKKATGKYIVFLDSDDQFLASHLSHLHQLTEEFPNINLFATKNDFMEGDVIFRSAMHRLEKGIYNFELFLRGNPFACNVCVKNNAKVSLIPFLEDRNFSGMEDWIFLFTNTWIQDIYHSDKTTVRMSEHPNRSMRFNKEIIEKRKSASAYIKSSFSLSRADKRKLKGYTNYFCAIHYYLDNKKIESFNELLKAIFKIGFKKEIFSLQAKLILGKKLSGTLKKWIANS
jgi:glycosyltransferase involved in cell wall biosynthesis